jgi:hypothetical protein
MPEFTGTQMWSYNAQTGQTHFVQATNDGHVHDIAGVWLDDDHFVAHWDGVYMGKQACFDYLFTFVSDKELHILERDTFVGGSTFNYNLVFKK